MPRVESTESGLILALLDKLVLLEEKRLENYKKKRDECTEKEYKEDWAQVIRDETHVLEGIRVAYKVIFNRFLRKEL